MNDSSHVKLSDGEKDWEVYLKSGISGTIPRNRIRVLPDEPLAKLNFESCKKEWRKLQSKPIKKHRLCCLFGKEVSWRGKLL